MQARQKHEIQISTEVRRLIRNVKVTNSAPVLFIIQVPVAHEEGNTSVHKALPVITWLTSNTKYLLNQVY